MTVYNVYDQVAEILAELNPAKIMSLKATAEQQERLEFLIEKSQNDQLSKKEKDELDHFIVLERLLRLAKIYSGKSPTAV